MNHIRRAFALTASAAMVTVAASACGGATTATGPPTNGLEKKSPADVLRAATAALRAAKSVHIVGADPPGHFDYRMQGSSTIGTITRPGRLCSAPGLQDRSPTGNSSTGSR